MNRALLKISLVKHEDKRSKPYRCSAGKLTIGVGRNLDDKGLRDDEIALMLDNDINDALADAMKLVPSFAKLSDGRQRVLVEMAFNLGIARFAKFKKFLAAVDAGDVDRAHAEMLDSAWTTQVGQRAHTLARLWREGD